jgi:hypothetical protein
MKTPRTLGEKSLHLYNAVPDMTTNSLIFFLGYYFMFRYRMPTALSQPSRLAAPFSPRSTRVSRTSACPDNGIGFFSQPVEAESIHKVP